MAATRIRMALDVKKKVGWIVYTNAVNPNTGFIPPASLPERNLCVRKGLRACLAQMGKAVCC